MAITPLRVRFEGSTLAVPLLRAGNRGRPVVLVFDALAGAMLEEEEVKGGEEGLKLEPEIMEMDEGEEALLVLSVDGAVVGEGKDASKLATVAIAGDDERDSVGVYSVGVYSVGVYGVRVYTGGV